MKRETIYRHFSKMPTLTTERLRLRPMRERDAEDMYRYACRGDVTAFLLWSPHPSKEYTREYLRYVEERCSLGDFYDFAVEEKESGHMIGTCGFTSLDPTHDAGEIGYVLNPEYQGKGYATEAAREMLRFGFSVLGLHRIEARFMKGNEASRHVMEKLGMRFEGYRRDGIFVKGSYRTIGVCAVLADEFS